MPTPCIGRCFRTGNLHSLICIARFVVLVWPAPANHHRHGDTGRRPGCGAGQWRPGWRDHSGRRGRQFFHEWGTIASLQQGGDFDKFFMSGGTITGAFEEGDEAKMTGGTIGRVDMKLANNVFDMSGGTIIGNLVTNW